MKKVLPLLFFIFFSFSAFCEDWTLGVMEFSFRQSKSRSERELQAATALPQLIIEQFSNETNRAIPHSETLDRKLKELQTERISLFLQLSKEYKSRDSLLLTAYSERKLKKEIKKEEKKIEELEKKISDNLAEVEKEKEKALPKILREEEIAQGKKVNDEKKNDDFFPFQLPFSFFREDEDKIVNQPVVLYKNDATALFKPSARALEAGFSSWDFEEEVTGAKINGLVSGEITTYGDYCSVTVSLRLYPGAKVFGTVTEVGLLSELMPLANDIARNLDSKISNALPVLIEFEIEPKEIMSQVVISHDGIVQPFKKKDGRIDNKLIDESGIHHIEIEAPGYESLSLTYSFIDDKRFLIHANLVPEVHGLASIRLKKYSDGIFHTYGLLQSPVNEKERVAKIEVNKKTVLGVFTVPKTKEEDSDSSNIAFFMIPENKAFDGASLLVNAKPFDRSAYIDKRRRWMYTAYTALICSLPYTFYNLGEFTAEKVSYLQGRGDYDRLLHLQKTTNIGLGITAVCGIWSAIELVRYLWAADRVLPAEAKIDKKRLSQLQSAPFDQVLVEEGGKSQSPGDKTEDKNNNKESEENSQIKSQSSDSQKTIDDSYKDNKKTEEGPVDGGETIETKEILVE